MATTPKNDEPGFETEVNELPESDKGSEDTLEDTSRSGDEDTAGPEDAQNEGAEERTEGGYH